MVKYTITGWYTKAQLKIKRLLDIIVSATLLIVFSPALLLVACLVLVMDGRPIFFRQKRPGLYGKPFMLTKFRTMGLIPDASMSLHDIRRVTKLGNILRQYSLDEIPSLWNVLKGDMSLIGPRPLLMEYLPLYSEEQKQRHNMQPGLSGLAQVNGRNITTWEKRFEYDVFYINNFSLMLDLKIIIKTCFILHGKGINKDQTTIMQPFNKISDKQ